MNKDCQLIFEAYKANPERPKPKFKVGDWVIISHPREWQPERDKDRLCQIKTVNPHNLANVNIYDTTNRESPNFYYENELEPFNINVKDEDKPTAADLLDI